MSTSVEVRDLSRRYGNTVHALRGASLAVEPGEFVTLLGPSGSGKSTILKLLAGFDQPTEGDILIDGRSVLDLPPHRRDIGMVFQNYALFPHLSVAENVAFPLRVRRQPEPEIMRRVGIVLEMTRLEPFRDRLPHELSGGQQQRVALARAIVFDPKILLMDEPLAALDRHLREQMKGEIKRIQQKLGMTVLFVTHDQDEALALSDRIGVMRDGRLEQIATPEDLYRRPRNRFVAGFVGDANILPCEFRDGAAWLFGRAIMPAATGSGPREGWLMIRPEQIEIAPADRLDGFPGQVTAAAFLGEATRYNIQVGPAALVARQPSRGAAPLAAGSAVSIRWNPEDAILLRD